MRQKPWTPGPWICGWGKGVTGPRASFGVYLTGKDLYRVPIRSDEMHPVAWVIEKRPSDQSQVDADARLIAAAPEMVELIEKYRGAASVTIAMDADRVTDLHNEADALLTKIYGDET